jgi:hypothetical protein
VEKKENKIPFLFSQSLQVVDQELLKYSEKSREFPQVHLQSYTTTRQRKVDRCGDVEVVTIWEWKVEIIEM